MKYFRRKSYLVSFLFFCLAFSYKVVDINRNLSCRRALIPSQAPVLVTEITNFSRTLNAKVSYFEFAPSDYTVGLYIDPLAQGDGIYTNRSIQKIELSNSAFNYLKSKGVLSADTEIAYKEGYVEIPLSKEAFNEIRKALPDFSKAQEEISKTQGIKGKVVAILPAGNIGWNDWFIGGVKNKEGNIILYYPRVEKLKDKTYSCIVGFEDGKVDILDLKISTKDGKTADKIWDASDPNQTDIKEKIKWFTFGQKILKEGQVNVIEVAHQFNDLRHLVNFPRIREENWGGKKGGKRLDFGLKEMWEEIQRNGVNNPITEDMLLYKALKGEAVELSTKSLNGFLKGLPKFGHDLTQDNIKEVLEKAGYKEAPGSKQVKRGEFWVKSKDEVIINFKLGIYPHIAIGKKDSGELIFAFFQGKSGREGPTVEEVAKFMRDHGAKEVLLLCNGGDVSLNINDKDAVPSPRENFIGFIYLANKGE